MQLKIQRSQRAGGMLGNTVLFCLDVRADYSPEEQANIRKYRLGSEIIYSSKNSQKHVERANAQLDRTQSGSGGERAAGLARGLYSLAMAKMSLNINIASLGRGHHIECKDLEELLEAEDTVRAACKNVTRYLEAAATFDGSETVIEYKKGEEKVHITQTATPLLSYAAPTSSPNTSSDTVADGRPDEHPSASYVPQMSYRDDCEPQTAYGIVDIEQFGRGVEQFGRALKQHWHGIEAKLMAFASSKGWDASETEIRLAYCGTGLIVLIVLWQIF